MANHTITAANSYYGPGIGFEQDGPGNGGTLTVNADAFLVTTWSGSDPRDCVHLGGNWIISVSGVLGAYGGGNTTALWLTTNGLSTASTLTVNAEGSIFAPGGFGFFTNHRTNVVNKGTISGNHAFTQSTSAAGDATLNNNGKIIGETVAVAFQAAGTHTILNTGTISGGQYAIHSEDGSAKVTNKGIMVGAVTHETGNNTLINSGTIDGIVAFGGGNDVFTNFLKVGNKTKSGIVTGAIALGFGSDHFNGGKTAEVVKGDVGNDVVKLGAGNDTFLVGVGFSGGGLDGNDIVDGGLGIDTYDASSGTSSGIVVINLDSIAHDGPAQRATGLFIGTDVIRNFENVIGTFGTDSIWGSNGNNVIDGKGGSGDMLFGLGGNDRLISNGGEQYGGTGNDELIGGSHLDGGPGNDILHAGLGFCDLIGGTGNDVLFGGSGNDNITGGLGKDRMTGGTPGGDQFNFLSVAESGVGAAKRDVITDYHATASDTDTINLQFIDANTKVAGDQTFNLVARGGLGAFTHTAGQLRFKYAGGSTIIEGDVNGDAKADFQIELIGHYQPADVSIVL